MGDMSEQQAEQLQDNGGSLTLDDAVLAMPDLDKITVGMEDEAPRGDDGRYQSREPVQEAEATEVKPDNATQEKDAAEQEVQAKEQDAAEETSEEEFDYIEIAGEDENAEPTRIKLEDAVDWYQKRDEIQAQLENATQAKEELPPTDWDQQALETVQYLQNLDRTIEEWQYLNPVQQPNEELLNPASPHYEPDLYYAQLQEARNRQQLNQHALAQREHVQNELKQRQEQLDKVMWQREKAKIFEKHPQLQEQAAILQLAKDLQTNYGIKPETLDSIRNSQAFDVIMDALAYRKSQSQREVVVKAVRAKPKLVKSQARDSQTPKQRANAEAQKRLAETGSLEDGADALAAFL